MPWGKHRGELIADIPSSYLAWLVENADDLRHDLEMAIRDELARRFGRPCPVCARRRPEMPRHAIDAELVSQWTRRLALQFHPDRGGSDAAMAAINVGRELLLRMMTEGGG
jgi:hypothetical protein